MILDPEPFVTARLDALPLRVGYADEMAAVLDDPALHTYTGGAPETADGLRARYRRQVAGSPDPGVRWWNWVLRVRDEGCLAGYVQATVDVPGAAAEIAWVVGTRWQGRGYAKEAAAGLVAHLLGTGAEGAVVRTVLAHIHPDHGVSAAVAGAAGLVPTEEWCDGERRWERGAGEGRPAVVSGGCQSSPRTDSTCGGDLMGTWDTGHFDNDTAADFSGKIDAAPETGREAVIRKALETVLVPSDYLDSDDGATAVAAAALVASQCPAGEAVTTAYGPDKPLPVLATDLRPLAVKALDTVLGENSELRELWDDAGDKEWAPGIARLREVLVAAAG